jgi:hypothetical protein
VKITVAWGTRTLWSDVIATPGAVFTLPLKVP